MMKVISTLFSRARIKRNKGLFKLKAMGCFRERKIENEVDNDIIDDCIDLIYERFPKPGFKYGKKTFDNLVCSMIPLLDQSISYFYVKQELIFNLKVNMLLSVEDEDFIKAFNYQKIYNWLKSYHNK